MHSRGVLTQITFFWSARQLYTVMPPSTSEDDVNSVAKSAADTPANAQVSGVAKPAAASAADPISSGAVKPAQCSPLSHLTKQSARFIVCEVVVFHPTDRTREYVFNGQKRKSCHFQCFLVSTTDPTQYMLGDARGKA